MSPSDLHPQARAPIPPKRPSIKNTMSMPSQWVNMYDDFITKNAHQVSQIESTLRSLTYIIPGTMPVSQLQEPSSREY